MNNLCYAWGKEHGAEGVKQYTIPLQNNGACRLSIRNVAMQYALSACLRQAWICATLSE